MKFQPNAKQKGNDDIQTPLELATSIVGYFRPTGLILEPCLGDGNFGKALRDYDGRDIDWCEIKRGVDFMDYPGKADWIITNPPWSQIQHFMRKSFEVAENVVFLMTVNHAMTTCRDRIMREAGFGIKEIILVDWPESFPKSGFLLGAVYWAKGHGIATQWVDLRGARPFALDLPTEALRQSATPAQEQDNVTLTN